MCVLGLHLAKELCEVDEDGDSWLQVTRRLPILPTLLTTLEVSLRLKQNLHFTEAALHLLLTLARTQQVGGQPEGRRSLPARREWVLMLPKAGGWAELAGRLQAQLWLMGQCRLQLIPRLSSQGATAVAGAGLTQSICLPLLSVYQLSTNGTGQVSARSLGRPPALLRQNVPSSACCLRVTLRLLSSAWLSQCPCGVNLPCPPVDLQQEKLSH